MKLKNKADVPVAECRKFFLLHTVDPCTVYDYRTAIRPVKRAHNLQQSRFSGTAGAHNADNLPFLYFHIDPPQYLQGTETLCYIF